MWKCRQEIGGHFISASMCLKFAGASVALLLRYKFQSDLKNENTNIVVLSPKLRHVPKLRYVLELQYVPKLQYVP